MLLVAFCLIAAVAAGPITYDQRQEGDFNAQVDISNLVFLFAIPSKIPERVFNAFSKKLKPVIGEREIQDRGDLRVMELFVKPSTPYHVEIQSDEKVEESDQKIVGEVVIAGKRRLENELPDVQEQDELKLLGATENCGPDRVRDSVTLMCKDKESIESIVPETPAEEKESQGDQPKPEVVPS